MAAQASVLLVGDDVTTVEFDGTLKTTSATVAADITMAAAGVKDGIAKWVDRSDGIAVGYPWMTLQVREPPKNGQRIYKVSLKVGVPRLATTSTSTNTGIEPAPQKAYEMQAHLDFLLPERSTRNERKKLLQMVAGLFHSTITASDGAPSSTTASPLMSAVNDLDPAW